MNDQVERVTAANYLDDLSDCDLVEVRRLRDECQGVESDLSYVRRLVQGRIDIVESEVKRRRNGTGERDLRELIASLPGILSDADGSGRNAAGRLVQPVSPGDHDGVLAASTELDHIASAIQLSSLSDQDDDEIGRLLDQLCAFERRISDQRRAVHTRLDLLQVEMTRRYQSGEANVDSLLA